MNDDKDKSRLVKIGVGLGLMALIFLTGLTVLGSIEIGRTHEIIANQNKKLELLSSELGNISRKTITISDIQSLNLKNGDDGKDGRDGINGKNGSDSQSTTTIIEKQTIIEKELPPQNGTDGKEVELGMSKDGIHLWKYVDDRIWQIIPIVDLTVGKK